MKGTAIYHSPLGDIQMVYEDGVVIALDKADKEANGEKNVSEKMEAGGSADETAKMEADALTRLVFRQLDEYFAGTRKTFDFPYRAKGTPFQEKVWDALRHIPYGETRSYKEIAEAIGSPKACRAVGMANHANPIIIAVPCHRVIGANGSLVGYGAGLEMKKALLEMEKNYMV